MPGIVWKAVWMSVMMEQEVIADQGTATFETQSTPTISWLLSAGWRQGRARDTSQSLDWVRSTLFRLN